MDDNPTRVRLTALTKFFKSARLEVVVSAAATEIDRVSIVGRGLAMSVTDVSDAEGEPGASVIVIQWLADSVASPWEDRLQIVWIDGAVHTWDLGELARERLADDSVQRLTLDFLEALRAAPSGPVLDIGGRERSGAGHVWDFAGRTRVVMDVIDDQSVDLVGDVHLLDRAVSADSYAAFVSISVFEHLLAPWQVVVQLNRVLKTGGVGFVLSHQTIGMHDQPADFWRFSDQAWRALFNESTGFTIENAAMDQLQYILPFVVTPFKLDSERAAGYGASAVLVRKVGPCVVDWSTPAHELSSGAYPS